jgi:hypothetical protein
MNETRKLRRAEKMTPRNGAASAKNFFASEKKNGAAIRDAVLKTLTYADLFDYPLHSEEIREGLFDCAASLNEVNEALAEWERRGVIEQHNRLFFIRGRGRIVAVREQRRQQTQRLLQEHAWLLRLVINFPFVRSVSLSGAGAFENCKQADDIDVFILAAPRRLWAVNAALVVLLNLLGKRKTICLNCLLDLDHLRVDDRDFFVAHQIAFLRPLSGIEHFRQFQAANNWIYSYLPQRRHEAAPPPSNHLSFPLKNFFEKILSSRIFDYFEKLIFIAYRRRLRRKTRHLSKDWIVIEPGQIKLFTNNHRHRIKKALRRRVQEILQRDFALKEVEASETVV